MFLSIIVNKWFIHQPIYILDVDQMPEIVNIQNMKIILQKEFCDKSNDHKDVHQNLFYEIKV